MVADPDLEQLAAHMRYRLAALVSQADGWRIDELTTLIVRLWPHTTLESIRTHGRNHAVIPKSLRLLRAQVREQWELRHGITPLWDSVLQGATDMISATVLDLWWESDGWRCRLRAMARRQREHHGQAH
jgi:hypothetical protein